MGNTTLEIKKSPEERELERKRAELAELESLLVQRELDLATLDGALRAFEGEYLRIVGTRYVELDELKARIAEALADLNPADPGAQARAAEARAQATKSAESVEEIGESATFPPPSDTLKKLFREVARRVHPDLCLDEQQRERRHILMAEANRAYETGDQRRLEEILEEWEHSPDSVEGEGVAMELVRILRKIALVEKRLANIESEIDELENSELHQLWAEAETAAKEGRTLLKELATRVDAQISDARSRLEQILDTKVSK